MSDILNYVNDRLTKRHGKAGIPVDSDTILTDDHCITDRDTLSNDEQRTDHNANRWNYLCIAFILIAAIYFVGTGMYLAGPLLRPMALSLTGIALIFWGGIGLIAPSCYLDIKGEYTKIFPTRAAIYAALIVTGSIILAGSNAMRNDHFKKQEQISNQIEKSTGASHERYYKNERR